MDYRLSSLPCGSVRLKGLLGARLDACRENRILPHDEEFLLWPYERKVPVVPRASEDLRYYEEEGPLREPQGQKRWLYPRGMAPRPEFTLSDWPGEFIGTWVATASSMAYGVGDAVLLSKLDGVLARWLSTQAPDGYLGTYTESDRWKSWDLWVEAHAMLGLLAYYEVSGEERALAAARRMADRVIGDFGPGRASVHLTGPHGGLASSSILEPLVLLYRQTQKTEYLSFARWLVDVDWEQPAGPKTISTLASGAGVRAVGNGKALEMLITLVGLLELFCETDQQEYFDAVQAAWSDIANNHVYVTGTASVGEYFVEGALPNDGLYNIGETCVTMAWINLCFHLHRLTGNARYLDPAEIAIYNHLLAAQSEDGRGWAYYVGLRDSKRYREHTDPECCPSRGSRALSLLPSAAVSVRGSNVFVNLFEPLSAAIDLVDVGAVNLEVTSHYPFEGLIQFELGFERPATFGLCLRRPGWCRDFEVRVNGTPLEVAPNSAGYLNLVREWEPGANVELSYEMGTRVICDASGNVGRVAFARGPLIYAADVCLLPSGKRLEDLAVLLAPGTNNGAQVRPHGTPTNRLEAPLAQLAPGTEPAFGDSGRYRVLDVVQPEPDGYVDLVPFYEAGNRDPDCYRAGVWSNMELHRNITYQLWLPAITTSVSQA